VVANRALLYGFGHEELMKAYESPEKLDEYHIQIFTIA
jgi:hypothetical protein